MKIRTEHSVFTDLMSVGWALEQHLQEQASRGACPWSQ